MGKKKATTEPKSLAISRDNTTFYFSWKIGDKDYKDGQWLEYHTNGGKYQSLKCGKKTTSSKVDNISNIKSIGFRVRGDQDSKNKGKSKWSTKEYEIKKPKKPGASAALVAANTTDFSYAVDYSNQAQEQFTNATYETVLIANCPTTDGSKVSWKGAEKANGQPASKTIRKQEAGWTSPTYSYTRWFRVIAHGWAGDSEYAYAYHTYAVPNRAENVKASYELSSKVGYAVKATWNSPYSNAHPIDSVTVQYLITTPVVTVSTSGNTVKSTVSCPNVDSGWVSLSDVSGVGGPRAMSFTIPTALDPDQCIFLRVNNRHDNNITYGTSELVTGSFGKLETPSIVSIVPGGVENLYTVTVDRNTTIANAWIAVYFRTKSKPNENPLIGIIPANETSTSLIIPEVIDGDEVSFGVRAYVSDYSPVGPQSDSLPTTYSPENVKMQSDINWDGGAVPIPPKLKLVKVSDTTVQASWNWSWRDANQAELSWSDHEDAWESTDEPQTYIVNSTNAGHWNIAGLGIGTWYMRIRLLKSVGDSVTYGTYSSTETIKLSSSPDIPALLLSDGVIGKEGEVTCYWAYVSTDGTSQMQAEVCEAFYEYEAIENPSGNPYEQGWYELVNEKYTRSFDTTITSGKTYYKTTGTITYGDVLRSTATSQQITLSLTDENLNLGWLPGETHHLAVRVMSASREMSEGWSAPVPVTIADEIHASIDMSQTSLVYLPVEIEDPDGGVPATRTVLSLTELPLTIKADGMGVGGSCLFVIERAESLNPNRPDGTEYEGFEGETVYLNLQNDNEYCEVSIDDKEHLIGMFDDGGKYRILVTVQDTYGQSDTVTSDPFEVHWNHQAMVPEATVELDRDNNVTMFTVIKPPDRAIADGYVEGDTFDIYRLSADRPELIISDGEFGVKYVDPYPALGEFGGHRVVYKTLYGDYITEDNAPAWTDYAAEDSDDYKHDLFGIVIDFGGEQLILPYNVTVSNNWQKDFTETHYLGGSVQGDWNPAVTKTASLTTVIPIEVEPEKVAAVRRLATYSGICHVRTPDGSSYAANVNVKDDREEKWTRRISRISMEINKIDTESFDGVTYAEWIGENES